jgi:hypothetical protein
LIKKWANLLFLNILGLKIEKNHIVDCYLVIHFF